VVEGDGVEEAGGSGERIDFVRLNTCHVGSVGFEFLSFGRA
jgi:hypothetical protein